MLIIEAAVLYLKSKEVIIFLDRVLSYLMSLPAKHGKTSLDARLKTTIYSARKRNKEAEEIQNPNRIKISYPVTHYRIIDKA